jgi:CheY-like chemotaxis protein
VTRVAPSGLRVLVVDDQPAFAGLLRSLLSLQGHHVKVTDSAQGALALLETERFDVVLSDYSLVDMTGAQLADHVAERGAPPFIALITGYATAIDDPTLLGRGIDAVLPKPCRADDLRSVLTRVRSTARPTRPSRPPQ